MASPLQALKLRQLVAGLRDLDRAIRDVKRHLSFLSTTQVDARALLRLSDDFTVESRSLDQQLARLTGEAESLARTGGDHPPLQTGMGQFGPSVGGELAELRALRKRLPADSSDLLSRLSHFRASAVLRMDEPGRWGDAAMPNPVNDLAGLLTNVLDLIRRIKRI